MFYLQCLCISPSGEAEMFLQYFFHRLQEGCDCTCLKSQSEPTWFYKKMRKKQTPFHGSDVFCSTTTCSPLALSFNTGALCRLRPPWGQDLGSYTALQGRAWQPGLGPPQGGEGQIRATGHSHSHSPGALGISLGLWVGPAQVGPMAK